MKKGVSVEKTAVEGGIRCCELSIRELESAAKSLRVQYEKAGAAGWADQKYLELGRIVTDCTKALHNPVDELKDCLVKLRKILQAVESYENVKL